MITIKSIGNTEHLRLSQPQHLCRTSTQKKCSFKLFKSAWNPEVQCRFRWQAGSIAFWDNRASQHFAASDYFPLVRAMERVTIAGDKPYFDAAA
ncbi:MAG: TauD/TfdA family dioxygenase [Halioglobus sp.]